MVLIFFFRTIVSVSEMPIDFNGCFVLFKRLEKRTESAFSAVLDLDVPLKNMNLGIICLLICVAAV